MRSDDDDRQLWDELYEQFGDRDGSDRRPRRRRARRRLRPGSSERLIDAALGVLGSVRVLIDVAEDVLVDQRERAVDDERTMAERAWTRPPRSEPNHEPAGDHGDTPTVRDIPFAD